MARSYSRDGSGKFAPSNSRGDRAETIQQNRRKKRAIQRNAKDALSGGKLGNTSRRRPSRNKTLGAKATTKAMNNSIQRAKSRFS